MEKNIENIESIENKDGVYRLTITSKDGTYYVDENKRKLDMVVISDSDTYWGWNVNKEKKLNTYYLFGIRQYNPKLDYSKISMHDESKAYVVGNTVYTQQKIFSNAKNTKFYFECIKNAPANTPIVEEYWKALPQFFVPCLVLKAEKNQKKIIKVDYLTRYLLYNPNNLKYLKENAYEINKPSICFYSKENKRKVYKEIADKKFTEVWLNFAKSFAKKFQFQYLVLEDAVSLPNTSFKGNAGEEFTHIISFVSLLNYMRKAKSFYEEYGFEVPDLDSTKANEILKKENLETTLQLRTELLDSRNNNMTVDFFLDFIFFSFYACKMPENIDYTNDNNLLKIFKNFYLKRKLDLFAELLYSIKMNELKNETFQDDDLKRLETKGIQILNEFKKQNESKTYLRNIYNDIILLALNYLSSKKFLLKPFDKAIIEKCKKDLNITTVPEFNKWTIYYQQKDQTLKDFILSYIINNRDKPNVNNNQLILLIVCGIFLIGNLKYDSGKREKIAYIVNDLIKETYLKGLDKLKILDKIILEENLDIRIISTTTLFKILSQIKPGTYFFTVINGNNEFVKSIIINNQRKLKILSDKSVIDYPQNLLKNNEELVKEILANKNYIFEYYELFLSKKIMEKKTILENNFLNFLIRYIDKDKDPNETFIKKLRKQYRNFLKTNNINTKDEQSIKALNEDKKKEFKDYQQKLSVINLFMVYFREIINSKKIEFEEFKLSKFFMNQWNVPDEEIGWNVMKNYPTIISSIIESLRLNCTTISYNSFYNNGKPLIGNLHLLFEISKFDPLDYLQIKSLKKIEKQTYFLNLALERKEIINKVILA
jgi:hypothetical protein